MGKGTRERQKEAMEKLYALRWDIADFLKKCDGRAGWPGQAVEFVHQLAATQHISQSVANDTVKRLAELIAEGKTLKSRLFGFINDHCIHVRDPGSVRTAQMILLTCGCELQEGIDEAFNATILDTVKDLDPK